MFNHIIFFLLNGAGTLILEVVWLKKQIFLFGSSPVSYGSILFAYFMGISIGSWHFRQKRGGDISLRKLYAGFILALIFSLCFPLFFLERLSLSPDLVYGIRLLYDILVWGLAMISIFPVCFYLGGFFPLISRTVSQSRFVFLYGVQACGTLLGIYFGSFYLPYLVGYLATFIIGIAVNIISLYFLQRIFSKHVRASAVKAEKEPLSLRFVIFSFLSGFFSLLLQVFWIRLIALGTDNSIYAFGAASLIVLIQLACSSYVTSKLPASWFKNSNIFMGLLFLSIIGIIASVEIYMGMTNRLAINPVRNATGLAESLRFAASFIFAGYFFPSFIFPFIMRMVKAGGRSDNEGSQNIGYLITANGIGCALGSLLTSFYFLPKLGIWPSLLIGLTGYSFFMLLSGKVYIRLTACLLAASLIFTFNPLKHPLVTPLHFYDKGRLGDLVWVKEGKYGIVSVIDYENRIRSLWLNNTYTLEIGLDDTRVVYRLGLLPTVLNPSAKSLVMIGVGTGMSSNAFLNSRIGQITLVELIPEVVEAAKTYFLKYNGNVFENPRVRTIIDDGRHYLRIEKKKFDIVSSDLFVPWNEGTAYLYTVDHFRNVKDKLNPDGLFCLWLPMYQLTREEFLIIAKSFATVFPHTTVWKSSWGTDDVGVALIGTEKIDTKSIENYISDRPFPELAPDLIQIHISGVFSAYVGPVMLSDPMFKGVPLNTLDSPLIEFKAAQKDRIRLKGKELIDLFEVLYKLPGNPDKEYFTYYDEQLDSYRIAGWHLNLYGYFYGHVKDYEKAEYFLQKANFLPALSLYRELHSP